MKKKFLIALTGFFLGKASSVLAQQIENRVEMADQMRRSGKIYVVVAVLVIIFLGIIAYLVSLDKKITKLEQKNKIN